MGLLSWLFSGGSRPTRALAWAGDGGYGFDVVGESHYQDTLEALCGGATDEGHERRCLAMLLPEPRNPYDSNAVAVYIDGGKVAYLSRRHAAEYHAALGRHGRPGQPAQCDALIVGGWSRPDGREGHFGVKLDLAWPPHPR